MQYMLLIYAAEQGECESLDEALAYAAKIPAAEHGAIEVRPVMQVPARA